MNATIGIALRIACVLLLVLTAAQSADAQEPRQVQLLAADFSADGSQVLVGGDAVRLLNPETGEILLEIPTAEFSRQIAFSPTIPNLFASIGDKGVVRLRQTPRTHVLQELQGHKVDVVAMDFASNGRFLATGGVKNVKGKIEAGEFYLWNVESGRLVQSLEFEQAGVEATAFSPDAKQVAFARNTADGPSFIDVYQVFPWKKLQTITFRPGVALCMSFTPEGKSLIIGGGVDTAADGEDPQPTGRLWRASLTDGDAEATSIETRPCGFFRSVSVSPDGKHFAAGTSLTRGLRTNALVAMHQLDSGRIKWSMMANAGSAYGVCFSPKGDLIAGCSADEILIISAKNGLTMWKRKLPQLKPKAG